MTIPVTKTYLPPIEEFQRYVQRIWDTSWVTNHGPLERELQERLRAALDVPYFELVANGTIALQVAIRALDLSGEIITTPFSYVATTTSILWERCKPVFVDITPDAFCIDPDKIESAISKRTSAILATHVYGYPCDVVRIAEIAARHRVKVIYDGAHAFGAKLNGRSLLSYGDLTTVSFHATKPFHTIEGGGVVAHSSDLAEKLFLYKSFGHIGDDYLTMGINGKLSEFHAAVGLCNLPRLHELIGRRRELSELYTQHLAGLNLQFPQLPPEAESNYAYYPVVFFSEARMLRVRRALGENGIHARRYFFPSLNTLPYVKGASCPVSEGVAARVLCLPLYHELPPDDVIRIAKIVQDECRR
jgi:dTDP-4-amino-4,6-dideoxygalactose transaminase